MAHEYPSYYSQEGNTPEPFNIDAVRQELAALRPQTPEAVAQALRQHFIPFAVETMTRLDQRASMLPQLTSAYGEQYHIPPSPTLSRRMSQMVAVETSNAMKQKAAEAYINGNIGAFNTLYDAAHGIALSVSELALAELSEDSFTNIIRTAYAKHTEHTDVTIPPDAKQDTLSSVKSVWEQDRQLLINDPSGISLVGASIDKARTNLNGDHATLTGITIQPYQISAFVLAGAELGKHVYTTTYAHTHEQSTLPQQDNQSLP